MPLPKQILLASAKLRATDYPCLVIRGICHYLDSDSDPEKTWKIWQDYAAITAATYANEVLKALPPLGIGDSEDLDTYIL